MITRLHLKRWKSHEDTELNFGKGSNLFIGKMGSGKSSAIDAISFALFGTFPSLKSRKVKIEELVMQRPKKHSTAEIELEFTHAGKKYKVVRHIGAKATSAQLFEDGKLLEAQTSRVTELIESILKIDYDLFSRIIYAEQNRIDSMLNLQKGDRKRQFDELLGISRFETVRANAGSAIGKLNTSKTEIERYLEGAGAGHLRSERDGLALEKGKAIEGLHHRQHENSEALSKLREHNRSISDIEGLERTYLSLGRDLAALEALLKEKKREFQSAQGHAAGSDLEQMREDVKTSEKTLLEKNGSLSAVSSRLSETIGRLEALSAQAAKSGRAEAERKKLTERHKELGHIGTLEEKLREEEKALEQAQGGLARASAQKAEIEKALSTLHHAAAKCPVCDSELSEGRKAQIQGRHADHLDRLKKEASGLAGEISSLLQKIRILRENARESAAIELRLADLASSEADLAKITGEISDLTKSEPSLKAKASALSLEIKALAEEIRGKERLLFEMEKIPKLKKEIEELEGRHQSLANKIAELKFNPSELEKARAKAVAFERLAASSGAQIAALSSVISNFNKMISDLEGRLNEISQKEGEAKIIKEKAALLSSFQEAVVETQALMREQLIEAMNEAMNSLWPTIYPYGDYKRIRLSPTDDDYEFQLEAPGGEWVGIENCSGGEKSCFALALRVAFAMVLTPSLSWLILDEPTHNLDSQAVQMLNRALREEIPRIVEQTFIITHDEALKEGASAKIFYFERDKDSGERSIVEEMGPE